VSPIIIMVALDLDKLSSYTDEFLVGVWHANETSVAAFGDEQAEKLGDALAREFTRRMLAKVGPSLWNRQGNHVPFAKTLKEGA
jgi:hypothetical protein